MNITPEMMAKLEQCKSAEDVLELAKQEKFSLTMEQSQKLFDLLQSENMTDEMMEKVTGGLIFPTVALLNNTSEEAGKYRDSQSMLP